jgi:hypothetical protein
LLAKKKLCQFNKEDGGNAELRIKLVRANSTERKICEDEWNKRKKSKPENFFDIELFTRNKKPAKKYMRRLEIDFPSFFPLLHIKNK